MLSYRRLLALCAVLGALVALPASLATAGTSDEANAVAAGEDEGGNKALEKKVVVRYARLFVLRKVVKGGLDAERDDIKGTCKRHKESTFWSCRFSVPSGNPDASCEATLRVYTMLGDPKASRYRVGCVL